MTVHPPKFSVLGDSISTFQGYCPVGAEHYAPDTGAATGVYTVEDTWWMQVIRAQGGVYLSNQSISGNTISPAGTMGGFSQKRLRGLSVEGEEPDHILLYAGLNDANFGIPLDVFAREYQALLGNLLALYPQAPDPLRHPPAGGHCRYHQLHGLLCPAAGPLQRGHSCRRTSHRLPPGGSGRHRGPLHSLGRLPPHRGRDAPAGAALVGCHGWRGSKKIIAF